MTQSHIKTVSFDVGGTLGTGVASTLTSSLVEASPLEPVVARRTMRSLLHVASRIDEDVIRRVSEALEITPEQFPRDAPSSPLEAVPGADAALQLLKGVVTLVTLSNVTCVDSNSAQLDALFPGVFHRFFASCDIGYAKPDSRSYEIVAKELGLAPEQVVHVGDDWACDVVGATEAGWGAVWVGGDRPIPDPAFAVRNKIYAAADLDDAIRYIKNQYLTE